MGRRTRGAKGAIGERVKEVNEWDYQNLLLVKIFIDFSVGYIFGNIIYKRTIYSNFWLQHCKSVRE